MTLASFSGSASRVCKNFCIISKVGAGTGAVLLVRPETGNDGTVDTNTACCSAARALRVAGLAACKIGTRGASPSSCCGPEAVAFDMASAFAGTGGCRLARELRAASIAASAASKTGASRASSSPTCDGSAVALSKAETQPDMHLGSSMGGTA